MWKIESTQEREDWKRCVGAGWGDLLDALFETLDFIYQDDCLKHMKIDDVKEKFGGLRFYASCSDGAQGAIDMAEHMSFKICEVCGKPGRANRGGWISVRCEECRPPKP